jgi:hypothetical protein
MVQSGQEPEEIEPSLPEDLPPIGDSIILKDNSKELVDSVTELQEAITLKKEAEELINQKKLFIEAYMQTKKVDIIETNNARIYNREQERKSNMKNEIEYIKIFNNIKAAYNDLDKLIVDNFNKVTRFKSFRSYFFKGD